jgi:hypothetical protein
MIHVYGHMYVCVHILTRSIWEQSSPQSRRMQCDTRGILSAGSLPRCAFALQALCAAARPSSAAEKAPAKYTPMSNSWHIDSCLHKHALTVQSHTQTHTWASSVIITRTWRGRTWYEPSLTHAAFDDSMMRAACTRHSRCTWNIYIYTYIYIYIYIATVPSLLTYWFTYLQKLYIYICIYIFMKSAVRSHNKPSTDCMCVYMYAYIHMCVYMHVYIDAPHLSNVLLHWYIHTCMHYFTQHIPGSNTYFSHAHAVLIHASQTSNTWPQRWLSYHLRHHFMH